MERNPEIEKLFKSWQQVTGNLNADVASFLTFAQVIFEGVNKLHSMLTPPPPKKKKQDPQIEMDV